MLTLKIYSKGTTLVHQIKSAMIVRPDAAHWEETLAELEYASRNHQDTEPYCIVQAELAPPSAHVSDPVVKALPLYGRDACYITNAAGKTVETVRNA